MLPSNLSLFSSFLLGDGSGGGPVRGDEVVFRPTTRAVSGPPIGHPLSPSVPFSSFSFLSFLFLFAHPPWGGPCFVYCKWLRHALYSRFYVEQRITCRLCSSSM